MQKVKVHRYVSGKRPDYAPMSSREEESEEDDFIEQKRRHVAGRPMSPAETMEQDVDASGGVDVDDPRLRRLKTRKKIMEKRVKMKTGWRDIGTSMHHKFWRWGPQMKKRRSVKLVKWQRVRKRRRRMN
jgi:hypothetical protein